MNAEIPILAQKKTLKEKFQFGNFWDCNVHCSVNCLIYRIFVPGLFLLLAPAPANPYFQSLPGMLLLLLPPLLLATSSTEGPGQLFALGEKIWHKIGGSNVWWYVWWQYWMKMFDGNVIQLFPCFMLVSGVKKSMIKGKHSFLLCTYFKHTWYCPPNHITRGRKEFVCAILEYILMLYSKSRIRIFFFKFFRWHFAPQPAIWKFLFLHYRSNFQSASNDFKFCMDLVHRIIRSAKLGWWFSH